MEVSRMIKFYEGELADLWPDQKSPEFLALSYAMKNAIILLKEKSDKTKCYSDIDKLDENVLDYMAVELRTMYYDQSLPIEQKREIIKKTLLWFTKAGTVPAVAEMIEVIFGTGKIVEWPDYTEPPYTRGTFDIITSALMTEDVMERLTDIIRRVKNVRSHIRRVVVERELHAAARAAIFQVATQESAALNILNGDVDIKTHGTYAALLFVTAPETVVLNYTGGDAKTTDQLHHASMPITTGVPSSYVTNEVKGDTEAGVQGKLAIMGAAESSRSTVTNDTSGSATAKGKITEAQRGAAIISNTFIKEEH